MRRALQQLRAVVATRVQEGFDSGRVYLLAGLFLFLPVAFIFVGFSLPVGLAFLLRSQLKLPQAVAYLGFLAGIAGGAAGLVAGLAVPYFMLKRHAERSRRRARDIVLEMEATTPVVCPACGGHASVVALGPDEPCPCPWCGAGLLPAHSAEAAVQAAARSLLAHHEKAAQGVLDELQRRHRVRSRGPKRPLPGYEVTAGGTVAKGTTAGVPVRAFNELFEGVFVHRVEVPVETGLRGEVFLVRPEAEGVMRSMAREWGYALPEMAAPSPREGWLAYVDGTGVPASSVLGATLDRLAPSDAMLLDPAGLSLWRKGSGLSYAWGLVREHHETMAALARALHSQAASEERLAGRS